jgi:hypothetical protein
MLTCAALCVTWYTTGGGNGNPSAGAWWVRVRPSYFRPVAGLIAVFGLTVGAGLSDVTEIDCFTGGIGSGNVHGVVGGLTVLQL